MGGVGSVVACMIPLRNAEDPALALLPALDRRDRIAREMADRAQLDALDRSPASRALADRHERERGERRERAAGWWAD